MNSWARTRKRIILAILFLALILLVGVPAYFLFRSSPTCSDGVQNGDETSIDCGGGCQKLCTPDSLPIVMKGDPRVLLIATSTYEVAALLQNPNEDAKVAHARYTLKLYGADSVTPLRSIEGEVYVPKGATFALFEGPLDFSDGGVPTRATLEWDESSLVWVKDPQTLPQLNVSGTQFSRLESSPRLEATIGNPSLTPVANVDLTALIFNADGNIMAASKTFIDSLAAGEEKQAIFTWPRPFAESPVEIEILTSILPDASFLR